MRRSIAVQLTLLPMLATAAVASADPPGATEPMLSPPGLTPTVAACRDAPENVRCAPFWEQVCYDDPDDPSCPIYEDRGGIFRGGFGHYFWTTGS